ncbi:MAG: hypothetical protein IPK80_30180 [Nannocystis sp.]|nr:hypothetical protein [Nannocystis sp.]
MVGQLAAIDGAEAARIEEHRRSIEAVARYRAAIEAANELGRECRGGQPPDDVVAQHVYLEVFEASAERDAALARLEVCRRILVRQRKKEAREAVTRLQREFAEAVEEAFDENNPYSRGQLTATVAGDVLVVRMKGNFGGRPRRSREQVDAWCAETSLFTRITLSNGHGTFSCVPSISPAEVDVLLLTEDGLLPPWSPSGPGTTPMPSPLPPPPPGNGPERLQVAEQAAALQSEVDAAEALVRSRGEDAAEASAAVARSERRTMAVAAERRRVVEESARNTHLAGFVVGGVGALSVTAGAYLVYERREVLAEIARAEQFSSQGGSAEIDALEAKAERQATRLAVGFGVGIPLVAAGVLLLVLGKQRKDSAATVAIGPGGLGFRF